MTQTPTETSRTTEHQHPRRGGRRRPGAPRDAAADGLGPIERASYRALCRAQLRFARYEAARATDRVEPAARRRGGDWPEIYAPDALPDIGMAPEAMEADPGDGPDWLGVPMPEVPSPLGAVATLALARALDRAPEAIAGLRGGGAIVVLDVPEPALFAAVRGIWSALVFGPGAPILTTLRGVADADRREYAAVGVVVSEPPKPLDRDARDEGALRVLSWGLPILGLSPSASTCLPRAITAAAGHRLTLAPIDAALLARVIRAVTGGRCRAGALARVTMPVDLLDLAVAVRHDRTPAACVAELLRLQVRRAAIRGGRALDLDDLHGLDPAVAWARATLADLAAWRRGEIGWDAIDHGVVLDGPPGTGKTLFAQVFARAAGLPLIAGSLSRWQGSGEGHLGHLLRAMRADFDLARASAPAVLFLDEIDAFPDRSSLTHAHRDYQVEVVNGLLEQLDGAQGRDGLIFVAASNDVTRCDPAIVRSGRLNRILRIELPDRGARARMLRVRLGADLPEADLDRAAELTERMSGADIERVVKDARRAARQAGRALDEADLVAATGGEAVERDAALVWRTAVHEAGHALVSVLIHGPADLAVALQPREGMHGWVERRTRAGAGTCTDLEREIAIALAGRCAEETVLGDHGAGSGGLPGSDLHQATRIACAMVGSFGQAGPAPLLFIAPMTEPEAVLRQPELRAAVADLLGRIYAATRAVIEERQPALLRVAAELLVRRFLDGAAVAALIRDGAVPERQDPEGSSPEHSVPKDPVPKDSAIEDLAPDDPPARGPRKTRIRKTLRAIALGGRA